MTDIQKQVGVPEVPQSPTEPESLDEMLEQIKLRQQELERKLHVYRTQSPSQPAQPKPPS